MALPRTGGSARKIVQIATAATRDVADEPVYRTVSIDEEGRAWLLDTDADGRFVWTPLPLLPSTFE